MADRWAIAVGRFYEDLANRLVDGASRVFDEAGGTIDVYDVPGAFELPLAAKYCAESGRYAGVVCLGAVIRGETPHFDYISAEASRGIAQLALECDLPVVFGVLTTNTVAQAIERADPSKYNRGAEAARTAIEMVTLLRAVRASLERNHSAHSTTQKKKTRTRQ